MASEILNFRNALLTVVPSLSLCYSLRKLIPKGFIRFLFVLPIVFLFFFLPLIFHTIHLQGSVGFFLAWLGTFKLLLFAFGKGPLCSDASSSSLARFLAVGSLPIEIPDARPPFFAQPNSTQNGHENGTAPFPYESNPSSKIKENPSPTDGRQVVPLSFSAKCGFLVVVISAIYYKQYLHPKAAMIFYCLVIYLLLEVLLGMAAALARATLGVELEPQFNEPYLSTSLQDFWGKRWNLMVTRILRPTVYEPFRNFASPIIGRKWASLSAVTATFVVSGLMHELIYFYMGRMTPTGEVTCFFLLHGLLLPAEIVVKRAVGGRFRLPRLISAPVTIGFVMITSFWLFFPQFLRFKADVRMFEEYAAIGAFLKNVTRELIMRLYLLPPEVK